MILKVKILEEIEKIKTNKEDISIICMRIYYHISNYLLYINTNSNFKNDENKIYNISSICTDNIECFLKNTKNILSIYTEEELAYMLCNIIITNIKYL